MEKFEVQESPEFQLISISLLREYLEIELKQKNLPFTYSLERTIGTTENSVTKPQIKS